MQAMTVPDRYLPGFLTLRDLPQEEYWAVAEYLADATPTSQLEALAVALAPLAEVTPEAAEDMLLALLSLSGMRRVFDLTPEEAAAHVASAPQLHDDKEGTAEELSTRIHALTTERSLRLLGKARDMQGEHDKLLISSRVMTDIRPIFPDGPSDGPDGALVSHTLKLQFLHDEGMLGNTFVTMDDNDLEQLEKAIARAKAKGSALRSMLKNTGLDYLGEREE